MINNVDNTEKNVLYIVLYKIATMAYNTISEYDDIMFYDESIQTDLYFKDIVCDIKDEFYNE
jgi:hypothetical protein